MARAKREALEAAENGIDYGAALAIITGKIEDAKTAQGQASKKAGEGWATIEKMGIHKGGAQAAAKIVNMQDADDRVDFLRSFSKLLEAAGIGIPQDLVDQAEAKPPTKVVPDMVVASRKSVDTVKPEFGIWDDKEAVWLTADKESWSEDQDEAGRWMNDEAEAIAASVTTSNNPAKVKRVDGAEDSSDLSGEPPAQVAKPRGKKAVPSIAEATEAARKHLSIVH